MNLRLIETKLKEILRFQEPTGDVRSALQRLIIFVNEQIEFEEMKHEHKGKNKDLS